mgnify:CR=1 FL=1
MKTVMMKQNFFSKAQPKLRTYNEKIKLIENRKMDNLKNTFLFFKKTAKDDVSLFKEIKESFFKEFSDESEHVVTTSDDEDFIQKDDDDLFIN